MSVSLNKLHQNSFSCLSTAIPLNPLRSTLGYPFKDFLVYSSKTVLFVHIFYLQVGVFEVLVRLLLITSSSYGRRYEELEANEEKHEIAAEDDFLSGFQEQRTENSERLDVFPSLSNIIDQNKRSRTCTGSVASILTDVINSTFGQRLSYDVKKGICKVKGCCCLAKTWRTTGRKCEQCTGSC